MKYEHGVSYYIVPSDYSGKNKNIILDTFNVNGLFVNNVNIHYDWNSGNGYAMNSVTLQSTEIVKLGTDFVDVLESDMQIIKWMHMNHHKI